MAKGPGSPKAARAAKGAAPKPKSPVSPKKIKGKVQVSKNKAKVTVKFAKEDKETRTSEDLTTDPDSYDVPLYLCPTPGNSGVCMNLADDSSKSMWSESETRRTKDKTQKPAKSGKKSPGAGKAAKGKGKASPKAQKKTAGSLQFHSQCTQVSSCWARSTQTAQCLTSNASCNTEIEDKKPCSRPTQTSICVVRNACCKTTREKPCIRSDVDAQRPGCSSSSHTHSTSLAALLSNVRNTGSPTSCHRSPYEKLGRAEDFCNETDDNQELPKNDTRVAATRCSFEMPSGCGPRFVSKYCRSKISRCHRPNFRECLYDSDCSVPSICSEPPRVVSEVIKEDKVEPEVVVVQKPEPEEEKPLIVHVREEVVDPVLDVVEEIVTGVETVVEDNIPKPVGVQITVEPSRQNIEVKLNSPVPEPEVVEFKPAIPEPKRESIEVKRNSSVPKRESVGVRRNSPEPKREIVEIKRNSPEPKLDYVKLTVPKPTAPILSCDYRIDRCPWTSCCPTIPRPQCFETCNFPFTDLSSRSSARSSRVSRYCDYDLEPCRCSSYRGGSRYYCKMAAAGALRTSCETKPLFKRWKWRHQFENS